MKKQNHFLAAFLLALVSFAAAPKEEIVEIGLAAPLTGDQAYIGEGVLHGAQMAAEDANAKGFVYGNAKLKIVPMDDQHNPTQAVLVANKLIASSNTVGVIGHFNSSCSKATAAIYHEARFVQISPASTNPEISKQGFDTFFRVCATDDVQAPTAANFVWSKLGLKQIAVIDDKTTYGKGLADQFERTFKEYGGRIVLKSGITQGEKDFTPLLTKIKSVNPELIFFGGIYPELSLLIKQAKKLGLDAPWMGGDGIYDSTLIKLTTPAIAEGTYATMLGVDPHQVPAAQDFVARYEARYGEIGSFSANGYDATNVLIEAIRRAGQKAGRPLAGTEGREAVLAEVRNTKDFPGIMGPINFDEKGDAVGKSVGIFRVEDGKFKFLEEIKP